MVLDCPDCGRSFRLDTERYAGKNIRVTCPQCQHRFGLQVPASPSGELPNLLVVDDSAYFRELLCDLLRPLRVRVFQAQSAEAAREELNRRRIDLLITDLQLPGVDGFDLIQAVRARYPYPILVVAVSAVYPQQKGDERLRELPVDAFLPKSFSPGEFVSLVKSLLERVE